MKRPSGKTPLKKKQQRQKDWSGKRGADTCVPLYCNNGTQVSAVRQKSKKQKQQKLFTGVFPLTAGIAGSGKTRPFEKRHVGCEEREKINRRRIYDTLRINFFEATKQTACIFSKGEKQE